MGLKAVFFGTPPIAAQTFETLLASDHQVVGAVTAPDRPRGRGMEVTASPVKILAESNGIPVAQPKTLRPTEVHETLAGFGAGVFVVAAYGQILPKEVLDIPRLGCINVHYSLLPALRGAAPVQWAIINGHLASGVTVFLMDEGLDTGPILEKVSEPIRPEDTTGDLLARLAPKGAKLAVDVLTQLESGSFQLQPQSQEGVSKAPKITPDQARIAWSMDATRIVNLIRGLNPQPGAWTLIENKRLKLWRASAVAGSTPGAGVLSSKEGPPLVGAGADLVELQEVQPEGGRRMSGSEFARGRDLQGARFE